MKKIIILATAAVLLASCIGPLKKTGDKISIKKGAENAGKAFQDAVKSGKSVICTYEMNGTEIETLVKGEKTRVNGVGYGQGNGGMINDGEWVYIWSDDDKTGTKYKIMEMEEVNDENETEDQGQMPQDIDDIEEWAAEIENQYEVVCKEAKVDDSEFVPPTDVEFKDMNEAMQKANEFKEKFEDKTEFSGEDMEEMNKMLEEMNDSMGQ